MTPSSSVVLQTSNQLIINQDYSKLFIRNNDYKTFAFTNSSGSIVQLNGGALMGQVGASQKVKPLASAATDGSQYPIGILATDYVVANGATVNVRVCVKGSVVKSKVLLDAADTWASLIEDRSIESRVASDTVGILLIESTENLEFDNQ